MLPAIRRLSVVALLALLAALMPVARPALAANFVVSNFGDSGAGTLRQAIVDANASQGPDTITFAGSGTITVITPLPELTGGGITIDGRLSGSGNTPRVELRGGGTVRLAGLYITSAGNTISGLIINSFDSPGILIEGPQATGNTIRYNYIGTNATGTDLGFPQRSGNNAAGGIRVYSGASSNTIENNVISGNGLTSRGFGIYIGANVDLPTSEISADNVVRNNIIGLDANGVNGLGNGGSGVRIGDNARNNTIENNVISTNGRVETAENILDFGVRVAGTLGNGYSNNNKILNNRIGTTADGTQARPNRAGGVQVDYSQGTIVSGNIISGNLFNGVQVTDSRLGSTVQVAIDAQITNNIIGLTAAGNQDLGNSLSGVVVRNGVRNVTITGNVITANGEDGVRIEGTDGNRTYTTSQVTITNNTIGLGSDKSTVIGTQSYGVNATKGAADNVVDNNTISGNRNGGVNLGLITSSPVRNFQVTNNRIGPRTIGGAVGNGTLGVTISNGTNNIVGPGNTIAGHTDNRANPANAQSGDGVLIQGANSTGNVVKGNTIQENFRGVRVDVNSPNNTIGGTTAADINIVRNNRLGVAIVSNGARGNRILHTTTTGNALGGIGLFQGGNGELAAPTITGVTFSGGTLTVNVTSSADCSAPGCIVEIFQNTVAEDKEGKFFLTSGTITSANGAVAAQVASCATFLTATITDKNGNTSPFSNAFNAAANGCTGGEPTGEVIPELSNPTPPTQTVASGPVSFGATLRNIGTQTGNFTLTVTGLPANWNATVTPNPANNLAPGGQGIGVTVNATIPANTDAGSYVATLRATAPGGASSSVQATIVVPLVPGLTFSQATQPTQTGGPGEQKCYVHTIRNTGNGRDTFTVEVAPPQQPVVWQASVNPSGPFELGRDEQREVTVCVTIPSGNTVGGNYTTTVTARSAGGAGPVSVTNTTTVTAAAVPQISPAASQSVTPDTITTVTFQHTITNIGNASDTFDLSVSNLPAGWTLVSIQPEAVGPIAPTQTSASVSYTVRIPVKAAAGTYDLSFRATARGGTKASAVVQDRVIVNRVASLSLTPETTTSTEEPDTTKTYEFTLTNDGNFTDLVTLGVTTSQTGWSARTEPAGPIEVAAGASRTIQVIVTIPPGQPTTVVNVTTLTATSSEGVSDTATATTNITSIAKASLTPKDPTRRATQGQTVTFEFTLQNSGSIADTFTTEVGPAVNTAPIEVTRLVTATTPIRLEPGQTTPIKVSVRVPVNQPDRSSISISITSTPATAEGKSATTIAKVVIGPPYDVQIEPDRTSAHKPGEIVRYTHYITNTGSFSDTFELSTISNLGWDTTISQPSVRLEPGASTIVTATVRVPTSANAGAISTMFVIARSVGDPTVADQAVDTTQVLQVGGVSFAPNRTTPLVPGKSIVFSHTLLNTGNGPDSFTITATQELSWTVTLSTQQTPRMGRGVSYPIQVQVRIPADAPPTAVNRVTLRATSKFDGTIYEEVVDLIRPVSTSPTGRTTLVYFPVISK